MIRTRTGSMEFSDVERMVAKVLSGNDINAQRHIICALIYYEKTKILEQLRDKWGDEYWFEVVETC